MLLGLRSHVVEKEVKDRYIVLEVIAPRKAFSLSGSIYTLYQPCLVEKTGVLPTLEEGIKSQPLPLVVFYLEMVKSYP